MNKPKYNPEMQLSENFRLKEFIESQTADQQGIDNRPDWEAVINLRNLCREVLQPLRDYEGKPIHVNSGYRCPELNEAVHGVGDSQHLYGEAADIHLPDKETVHRRQPGLRPGTLRIPSYGRPLATHQLSPRPQAQPSPSHP